MFQLNNAMPRAETVFGYLIHDKETLNLITVYYQNMFYLSVRRQVDFVCPGNPVAQ